MCLKEDLSVHSLWRGARRRKDRKDRITDCQPSDHNHPVVTEPGRFKPTDQSERACFTSCLFTLTSVYADEAEMVPNQHIRWLVFPAVLTVLLHVIRAQANVSLPWSFSGLERLVTAAAPAGVQRGAADSHELFGLVAFKVAKHKLCFALRFSAHIWMQWD